MGTLHFLLIFCKPKASLKKLKFINLKINDLELYQMTWKKICMLSLNEKCMEYGILFLLECAITKKNILSSQNYMNKEKNIKYGEIDTRFLT